MDQIKQLEEPFIHRETKHLKRKPKLFGSCRLKFGIIMFILNIVAYLHFVNLNMTIVCMIEDPEMIPYGPEPEVLITKHIYNVTREEEKLNYDSDKFNLEIQMNGHLNEQNDNNTTLNAASGNNWDKMHRNETQIQAPKFDWNKSQISTILSSFYYGLCATQLLGSQLSHRFGGKHIVSTFLVCAILCSFIAPSAAEGHFILLLVVRIVLGSASGLLVPALHALVYRWTTPTGRATWLSFIFSGQALGIATAYMSAGYFCALGWSSIFYVHGGVTVIMLMVWLYEIHSSPDAHPRITEEEKQFLKQNEYVTALKSVPPTPWKALLTSKVLYAIALGHSAYNWSYFTVIINGPMFLKEVCGFIIEENGVLSAGPYLFCTLSLMVSGRISDAIIKSKILNVQRTRKLLAVISLGGTAVCLISIGQVTYQLRYLAVILVCLSCIFSGLAYGGLFPSIADFSGIFSGTAFALSNMVATMSVILSANVVGLLTPNGLKTEWQRVFYIAAGINCLAAIVFVVFGRNTLQSWARTNVDTLDIKVEIPDKATVTEEHRN